MSAPVRLLALAATALAQVSPPGGTVGVWDHIQPNNNAQGSNLYPGCPTTTPGCTGPVQLWSHSAFTESAVYVAATTADSASHLWAFDVVSWVWTPLWSQALPNFDAADLFSWAGFVLALGGTTDDYATQLAYLPVSQGAAARWATAQVSGAPAAHDGHRFIVFGGVLYMMGGITPEGAVPPDGDCSSLGAGCITSNTMWGLDLAAYFAAPSGVAAIPWVRVQKQNSAGVWSPRGAFSLNVYSATVYLFGGLKRNESIAADPVCEQPGANCVLFNDLWAMQPGFPTGPLTNASCGGGNCGWSYVQVTGATVPPPRFNHAAGVLADNLYIFGGATVTCTAGVCKQSFLTDLWVFNIEDSVWLAVTSTIRASGDNFPGGTFPVQQWAPSMAVVGHNLYVEMTGGASGNAMYRWVPEAPAPAGPAAAAAPASAGHTAGIVIGILLGLANFGVLSKIAGAQGVDLFKLPGAGSGAARAPPTADSFYAAQPQPAAAYTAPSL